ncbi:MAG: SDR family NAD(P)-dependent oxidoreductase [Flavobacteriales bacterium]|tara:strand:+ start:1721 stop:2425 length:705 start_codon:yes stop_codon:yes gene_type:complete
MNLFYITGTSSGIGYAIATLLLKDSNNIVIGISRRNKIEHKNYHHISHDLSLPILANTFEKLDANYNKIVLINNAGQVGPVTPMGKQTYEEINQNYAINLVAPTLLCNDFIGAYKDHSALKMIINVSSGAGKHAIESWNTYCASKAALDMLSLVIQAEHPEFKVYALAPGIVDTEMQAAIREANKEDFPHLEKFVGYKKEGELADAGLVAQKYLKLIENPELFKDTICSVRDID